MDANFTTEVARTAVSKMYALINVIKNPPSDMRQTNDGFFDALLDACISKAIADADLAYSKMNFREAQNACFFVLSNNWNEYCSNLEGTQISAPLRDRYINTSLLLLTPIAPQFTDYCWTSLLGHTTTIVNEPFPKALLYDSRLFFEERLINKTADAIRKRLRKVKNYNRCAIFVRTTFTPLQEGCLQVLRSAYDRSSKGFNEENLKSGIEGHPILSITNKKEYMAFLSFYKQTVPEFGDFLLAAVPEIDQVSLLENNKRIFMKQLKGIKEIEILTDTIPHDSVWSKSQIAKDSIGYLPTTDLILGE
jgi:leucyl-tRNA synthetase